MESVLMQNLPSSEGPGISITNMGCFFCKIGGWCFGKYLLYWNRYIDVWLGLDLSNLCRNGGGIRQATESTHVLWTPHLGGGGAFLPFQRGDFIKKWVVCEENVLGHWGKELMESLEGGVKKQSNSRGETQSSPTQDRAHIKGWNITFLSESHSHNRLLPQELKTRGNGFGSLL